MLPAEDLLKFADLEALANPDKVAPKPKSPPPQETEKEEEPDEPVPARFPEPPKKNAPQRRRRDASDRPARRPSPKPTPKRRPPSRSKPSPPAPPATPSVWTSDYQVENGRREVYEVRPHDRYYDDPYEQPPQEEYYSPPPRREPRRRPRSRGSPEPRPRARRSDRPSDRPSRRPSDRPSSGPRNVVSRAPPVPQVSPEEMRRRREEEENKEKMQLLHKLYQYEQRGHRMANAYSMDSNIDELRFEVSKIRHEESAKHSVKWYKVFLMIVVSTVEALNTRFDPFGIRLKGWSKDMNEKKDDLDDCFHRLHEEYSSKSTIHPALELAFAFFGGAFMYHLQNAAENYSELGGMLSMISTGGKSNKPASAPPPKVGGWSAPRDVIPPAAQPEIMTNMPLFQGPMPPVGGAGPSGAAPPKVGRNGRRIMRGPEIPGAGSMVNMEMMSMMSGPSEPSDDVPIDFTLPKTVGGYKPTPSSTVTGAATGTVTGAVTRPPATQSPSATRRRAAPAPKRAAAEEKDRSGRGLDL